MGVVLLKNLDTTWNFGKIPMKTQGPTEVQWRNYGHATCFGSCGRGHHHDLKRSEEVIFGISRISNLTQFNAI